MQEAVLEQYFRRAATKIIAIGHTDARKAFYRINNKYDLGELQEALRFMTTGVCLGLEMGDGQLGEWDNPNDKPRIGLHLLVKASESHDDIKAARDHAKSILLILFALMRKDCEEAGSYADDKDGPLKELNAIFNSEGNYGDMDIADAGWYGKCIYFNLKFPVDLSYNDANYNNTP